MNSIDLRKCIIIELKTKFKSFLAEDLSDGSQKEIFLSGKQGIFYTEYKVGDIVYAAKSIENTWRLITYTRFKRNEHLYEKKMELDKRFPFPPEI